MSVRWRKENPEKQRESQRKWYYKNRYKLVQNPQNPIRKYNKKIKLILICDECGKSFPRLCRSINRDIERGRKLKKVFCNSVCSHKNLYTSKQDKFSPFRRLCARASRSTKRKSRNLEYNLNAKILYEMWEKQNGKCIYSGIKMELPQKNHHYLKSPFAASIDRIDSTKGYIPSNVELVCRFVNLGKSSFSKESIMQFFRSVANEDATVSKTATM